MFKIEGKNYCGECGKWFLDFNKECPKCKGKLEDHFTGYVGRYFCKHCRVEIVVIHSGPHKRNKRCCWCKRFIKFMGEDPKRRI